MANLLVRGTIAGLPVDLTLTLIGDEIPFVGPGERWPGGPSDFISPYAERLQGLVNALAPWVGQAVTVTAAGSTVQGIFMGSMWAGEMEALTMTVKPPYGEEVQLHLTARDWPDLECGQHTGVLYRLSWRPRGVSAEHGWSIALGGGESVGTPIPRGAPGPGMPADGAGQVLPVVLHADPKTFDFEAGARDFATASLEVPASLTQFLDVWPWLPADAREDWIMWISRQEDAVKWCLRNGGLLAAADMIYAPLDQPCSRVTHPELGAVQAELWTPANQPQVIPTIRQVFTAALSAFGALPMISTAAKYAFRGNTAPVDSPTPKQ